MKKASHDRQMPATSGPTVSSKEDGAQMNSISNLIQMWQTWLLGQELPHALPTTKALLKLNTVGLISSLCLAKLDQLL